MSVHRCTEMWELWHFCVLMYRNVRVLTWRFDHFLWYLKWVCLTFECARNCFHIDSFLVGHSYAVVDSVVSRMAALCSLQIHMDKACLKLLAKLSLDGWEAPQIQTDLCMYSIVFERKANYRYPYPITLCQSSDKHERTDSLCSWNLFISKPPCASNCP